MSRGDGGLLAGDAGDGEEAHQPADGGVGVDGGHHGVRFRPKWGLWRIDLARLVFVDCATNTPPKARNRSSPGLGTAG